MNDILKVVIPIVVTHVCVLAVIIVIIKKLLLNDTMKAVQRIRTVEAEVRKKEESIRRDIADHEKAFASQKAKAEDDLQKHKVQTEKELTRLRDQMLADANSESDRILKQARKNEEKLRQKISQEMEQKAVDYGAEMFQLVFSDKVNAELNKQFINELLEALEEVEKGSITIETDEGDVRTSQAMDPDQKKRLEELLADKFSRPVHLTERSDPDLLSGLVLKIGSLEIDGSLRNRFDEAIVEITKSTAA